MLLAIDIGNTNITFGLFKNNCLKKKFNIPSKEYSYIKLKKELNNSKINGACICSVVPKTTKEVAFDLKKYLLIKPKIIGKNLKLNIKNLTRFPKQVGADRLVNAYYGINFYKTPLIVIDFGTAITFDCISKNNAYLGGLILPGLEISLDALHKKTALLPKIKLGKPKEIIGRDTFNSINSGIIYGFCCLTQGLVKKLKSKLGSNTKIIATGGAIRFFSKYCKFFDTIDEDLTIKSLNLIYSNK